MRDTEISWADDTVNPWWGCVKVSAACTYCYAEGLDRRFRPGGETHWGPTAPRLVRVEKALRELATIARRAAKRGEVRRVFVASMADVFEARPDVAEARLRFLTAARSNPVLARHLRLLLLTKRPQVMAEWARVHGWEPWWWAGTTVEDQQRADERIPHLLQVPAEVRFLSCEPLLGPIELPGGATIDGEADDSIPGIHWVIAGGESGRGARPTRLAWARSLRDQCQVAGVPYHWKQWGEHDVEGRRVGKRASGRLLDGRTWDELPRTSDGPGGPGGENE